MIKIDVIPGCHLGCEYIYPDEFNIVGESEDTVTD